MQARAAETQPVQSASPTPNDLQDELGMTRNVLSAAQQQLIEARRSASAARQAEERALAAVLKTRDEARMQVMQACDEAKQQP